MKQTLTDKEHQILIDLLMTARMSDRKNASLRSLQDKLRGGGVYVRVIVVTPHPSEIDERFMREWIDEMLEPEDRARAHEILTHDMMEGLKTNDGSDSTN